MRVREIAGLRSGPQSAPFCISSDNFHSRRKRLAAFLQKNKLEAYFFSGISDLHYLTGFQSDGFYGLFTTAGRAWLFSSALLGGQIRENTDGCSVLIGQRLSKVLPKLQSAHKLKRIGFDVGQVLYELGARLVKLGLTPQPNPLVDLRAVKEHEEMVCLRRAGHIAAQAIDFIRPKLRVGVTERQLAAQIESFFYRQGSEKMAFDLIVAMGPHTALPHHVTGDTPLRKNQPVIFDIGCTVGGYRSDLTRTVFYGKINRLFQRVFDVVKTSQKAGMDRVCPGSRGGQVDAAARRVISRAGYGRFFIHSTGHGVGLDIHESPYLRPRRKDVLKSGMVLTVEPGIYLPGQFGVRIEDTLQVTTTGHEILTK